MFAKNDFSLEKKNPIEIILKKAFPEVYHNIHSTVSHGISSKEGAASLMVTAGSLEECPFFYSFVLGSL